MTAIQKCPNCKPHAYQDAKYGASIRVQNVLKNGSQCRCTVCGSVNTVAK